MFVCRPRRSCAAFVVVGVCRRKHLRCYYFDPHTQHLVDGTMAHLTDFMPSLEMVNSWTGLEEVLVWAGLLPDDWKSFATKLGEKDRANMGLLAAIPPRLVASQGYRPFGFDRKGRFKATRS